ncbi:hypothetical protein E3P77_00060 [Wallemia ichthyophaga]|nr:hypothetical protein E3P98_00239 [Wallemia ichthyophaga]TIB70046.1 hypothetical protein E3P77_00060 [Wallemia ichthyophaga]
MYQRFNAGAGPSYAAAANPSTQYDQNSSSGGPLGNLKEVASKNYEKFEDFIDTYTQGLKPYLPAFGRFLIVVTFIEDALRILTQWKDQMWYLQRHRHFFWILAFSFLVINVVVMLACSFLVVRRQHALYAVGGLLGVVVVQGFGYGLIFDLNFFLRNLSVIGGLMMVLSESFIKKKNIFAGLPSISETDKRKYFQLAGRVLLVFLFIGFVVQGEWSLIRIIFSVIGLLAVTLVVVGFKTKWSATFLVLLLSIFNILINNWWSMHHAHHQRDFLKYDFFQTLSIVGGLLLLVNMGPGGISVDEKKKVY